MGAEFVTVFVIVYPQSTAGFGGAVGRYAGWRIATPGYCPVAGPVATYLGRTIAAMVMSTSSSTSACHAVILKSLR